MKRVCVLCGGPAVNEQEYLDAAADEIAKDIDKQVMLYAGLMHAGDGGYKIGNQKDHDEFVKKRNYTYGEKNDKV